MGVGTLFFTPAEAAVITGLEIKTVNNAIDRRLVPVGAEQRARLLSARAVLCLAVEERLSHTLSPPARRQLIDEFMSRPQVRKIQQDPMVSVDLTPVRRNLAARMQELRRARRLIVSDPEVMGGEPVFRGTRVPVHLIAEMLSAGATSSDILEGYPSLIAEMVRAASIYAAAYPRRGRPKKQPRNETPPVRAIRIPFSKAAE